MAEQLLDRLRDAVDGPIDFEGQKLSELVANSLLIVSATLAIGVGYVLEDIRLALYVCLAGAATALLATVPPWPVYNKHPIQWYEEPAKAR